MAPAILNTIRSTITAHLAARSDFAALSPLGAHALLTARDRVEHIEPGLGLIPPQKINNNAVFAIFGIIGAGFVIVGIWFFFWAKNGGFYFKEDDWDDYKSTVLRRKGPNGTTLSGATESTILGGGSVYKDVDEGTEDATTVISGTTAFTGITGGVSDVSGREKRRKKREQKERDKERRREEKSREKEAKRQSRRKVGVDNIIIDPEAEQQAHEQLRSYRHEKPARVGGLNRESEASEWDGSTNPSYSNASGSGVGGGDYATEAGSTVTSDLMGDHERTPTRPKAAASSERGSGGIRKVYSTADKNASRENERLRAEARRLEKEKQRASRRDFSWAGADETMALRRIDEQSEQSESLVSGSTVSASLAPESRIPGAWAAESSVGTASDVGTKVYKHSVHIPVSNESTVSTDFAYADEKRKKRGGAGARRRAADAESSVVSG